MVTRMELSPAILVTFLLAILSQPGFLMNEQDSCMDLAEKGPLDLTASTLVIDQLISVYHRYKNWSAGFASNLNSWKYTIDLKCLRHLTRIENIAKEDGSFIDLARIATGVGSLRLGYTCKELGSVMFVATILISSPEQVTSLHLNNNPSLTELYEGSFSLLRNLTSLNLASNGIGPDPAKTYLTSASFKGLDQLTHLSLAGNPLNIYFEADFFIHLKQLKHLDLSRSLTLNRLRPGALNGLEKLTHLNLSLYEHIFSIPRPLFAGLKSLKVLDLSGIKVFSGFTGLFNELTNLTELVLTDFNFGSQMTVPEKVFEFPNSLLSLNLSCRAAPMMMDFIGHLRGLSKLQSLSLRNRRFKANITQLRELDDTPIIRRLDLAFNFLDATIFERLAFLNRTLEWLNLEENLIELNKTSVDPSSLCQLKELFLGGNIRTNLDGSLFYGMNQLANLSLASNKINRLTVKSFVGLGRLKNLDLANNFIQTIENGTFAPLANLVSLDLSRNPIRNLFFFGLNFECSIYHDGLNVFNISFIDLGQMSRSRESFLQKTVHLRDSKRLRIYRNVQVSWRSASSRPNCSLYFQVLRGYRPITFKMDDAYLEECSSEDLHLSSSSFFLEDFQEIAKSAILSPTSAPRGAVFQAITSDGFLLGLSENGALLTLNRANTTHSFRLDARADELTLISDHLLVSIDRQASFQKVWNISNRSNVTYLATAPSFAIQSMFTMFTLSNRIIVTFDPEKQEFCFAEISSGQLEFECAERGRLSVMWVEPVAWLMNDLVVLHDRRSHPDQLEIMSMIDFYEMKPTSDIVIRTGHAQDIDALFVASEELLISASFSGEIKAWSVLSNGTLLLKNSIRGGAFLKMVALNSEPRNDVLVACLGRDQVNIYSVRYGKQVEAIPMSNTYANVSFFGSFNTGMLVLGNKIYQF